MFHPTDTESASGPKSRTINVLLLLTVAALVFSYLGAYAVTNTLVGANMLSHWPDGEDPRPRWMLTSFVSIMCLFTIAAALLRILSGRQLRSLDAIGDADEEFRIS